jgi:Ni/Co efflux regulator RcnB
MKMPRILIAGLSVVMIGVTPLLQAAPGNGGPGGLDEQRQGGPGPQQQAHQQPGSHAQHGNGNGNGNGNRGSQPGGNPGASRGGPPQDFGPVRQVIQNNRDAFRPGNPPPANIRVVKGQPLPRGYGARMDARALQHLPRYEGYEWRRLGTDVVLIAIGTGIVYEVLQGVLN